MATNEIYPEFTAEMKQTHTILIPNALPMHFSLMGEVFRKEGYHIDFLNYSGQKIIDTGLKYVHNDACYPAIIVIGQLIYALESGDYDPKKTALMLYQTGGGCRASNYVHLLRKALKTAGFAYVPVVSVNFGGIEKNTGFRVTAPMFLKGLIAWLYGDFIMLLRNQVRPYEKEKGACKKLTKKWTKRLNNQISHNKGVTRSSIARNFRAIADDFNHIPITKKNKPKVGIVGELYVKYADFGNNHLQDYLVEQGAEIMVPGILGFALYSLNIGMENYRLYGDKKGVMFSRIAVKYVEMLEKTMLSVLKQYPNFEKPISFQELKKLGEHTISRGVCMGEGWLLTAEMAELIEKGYKNIVCVQPFGCLPNHIAGKGMIRSLNEQYKEANICAIDYDAGATKVNQENRIKLMLALARES
ncbi:MAG: 2-hydroxyglutaryl-CoA dehydratase [Lachnospiraceae bacterium]|nr:2-hydroxyglutaryl-CoA dehydratase [Lachnospiraceae bacterium]